MRRRIPALIADLLAVVVFVLLGRRSHDEGSALAGTVATAWPFVAGAAAGELAAVRLDALAADARHVLLTGDLNVAHREADLKNWKGNLKKAGFLPQERAWFDRLLATGAWVDVVRALSGEGPGPYSWWSWRGKAFDLDSGWRIDYQIASAGLAERAVKAETDRAPSYAERWSDHAPVVVRYEMADDLGGRTGPGTAASAASTRSRPECLAS